MVVVMWLSVFVVVWLSVVVVVWLSVVVVVWLSVVVVVWLSVVEFSCCSVVESGFDMIVIVWLWCGLDDCAVGVVGRVRWLRWLKRGILIKLWEWWMAGDCYENGKGMIIG